MSGVKGIKAKIGVAMAAATILAVPAIAVAAQGKSRPPAVALSFDRITTFTPASADPRLAAAFAGRSSGDRKFQVHARRRQGPPVADPRRGARRWPGPGAAPRGRSRHRAGRDRADRRPASASAPRSAGSASRSAATSPRCRAPIPRSATARARSSASATISSKFTGRVALGAERSDGRIAALSQPDNVSVDVGAAYNLSRRVAVTGGVRYRVDQDRVATLSDQRRDSQAVYVGTAFKF